MYPAPANAAINDVNLQGGLKLLMRMVNILDSNEATSSVSELCFRAVFSPGPRPEPGAAGR